jgi:hypothetical protein
MIVTWMCDAALLSDTKFIWINEAENRNQRKKKMYLRQDFKSYQEQDQVSIELNGVTRSGLYEIVLLYIICYFKTSKKSTNST